MACRSGLRTVLLTERWMISTLNCKRAANFRPIMKTLKSRSDIGCELSVSGNSYHFVRNCSNSGIPSSSSDDSEQEPPQEAVLKAISEVSKSEGRVGKTTNVVIGSTATDDSTDDWVALDQRVNTYPTVRGFTAIGTGGDDFVHAMIVAVESVLQVPIPEGQVKQKISSHGKYVSVNIGPVQVVSSQQVQAVYSAMRQDERVKYFL